MDVTDIVFDKEKIIAAVVAIAALSVCAFVLGWQVNGWRKDASAAKDIAAANGHAAELAAELSKQNIAIELMAKETLLMHEIASKAQGEADKLRRQAKSKAKVIIATPASSCGDVVRDQWGRI